LISEIPTSIHRSAGIPLPLSLLLILNFNHPEDVKIVMPGQEKQLQEFHLANTLKVSERNGSNKLAMSSAKASAVTAARMLDFVREMSLGSEDFSQRQSDYWIFVLQDYSPPMIERAFHRWVKQSKHMPVPSEIITILDAMVADEERDRVAGKTKLYLNEMRDTRQRLADSGQPCGEAQYHSLMKEALEVVKSFPAFRNPNRPLMLRERLARAHPIQPAPRKSVAKVDAEPLTACTRSM
jgi:hypothetical protein